jgi:NitT/TauT family transport system permease protein
MFAIVLQLCLLGLVLYAGVAGLRRLLVPRLTPPRSN